MITRRVGFALGLGLALTSAAWAQCCAGKQMAAKADPGHGTGKCAATCDKSKAACAEAKATCEKTGMPLMQYKVGDKTTNCSHQAADWAKDSTTPTQYILGDQTFTDRNAALQAYEARLNDYLGTLTTVQYAVGEKSLTCPMAAGELAKSTHEPVQFRVASFNFTDQNEADTAVTAAKKAADEVTMKKIVDGKEMTCAKGAATCGHSSAMMADGSKQSCKAGATVAASDKDAPTATVKCEYQVGDVKTPCEQTAKVELARARIIAAVQALDQAAHKDVASDRDVVAKTTPAAGV
jgi:hypothetical protein